MPIFSLLSSSVLTQELDAKRMIKARSMDMLRYGRGEKNGEIENGRNRRGHIEDGSDKGVGARKGKERFFICMPIVIGFFLIYISAIASIRQRLGWKITVPTKMLQSIYLIFDD